MEGESCCVGGGVGQGVGRCMEMRNRKGRGIKGEERECMNMEGVKVKP